VDSILGKMQMFFISGFTELPALQIHSASQATTRHPVPSCAHGYAGPGCPQCGGGGGGGGVGGAKRNTAGLMTWNEAWAVWNALKTNNARQADYLKGVAANRHHVPLGNGALSGMTALMARFVQAALPTVRVVADALGSMGRSLTRIAQGMQQSVLLLLKGVSNKGMADKLASLLGDGKKLLEDVLHHNVENLKSLLARLQLAERLAQVSELMEKALRELASEAAQWVQDVAEQFQRALERIGRWFRDGSRKDRKQGPSSPKPFR
jgi:hypothetical protein